MYSIPTYINIYLLWFQFLGSAMASQTEKSPVPPQNKQKPHILYLIIDDLGSHDLGMHQSGIETPQCDALARLGVYLEQYYVLPYCSPTRASILSGRYPVHHGLYGVIHDFDTQGLPLDEEILPQILQKVNYRTHAVGKWHVGHSAWGYTPTFRGFESFYGFYLGGQNYTSHTKWGPPFEKYDLRYDRHERCGEGCSQVVDERGNYSTHVFTRQAIWVIGEHAATRSEDEPLFLYLAHQGVHYPDQVPDEYYQRYADKEGWTAERKIYAGMLTAVDESIGKVIEALKKRNMWNDTLVVVTTDNGGPTDICAVQGSSNYPKRGGKCTVYEGGTTGDAFLAGPALTSYGGIAGGHAYPYLFHAVDWLPTILDMVGSYSSGKPLDGKSHLEALRGSAPSPRQEVYIGHAHIPDFQAYWYGPALRYQNFKIIQGHSGGPESRTSAFPSGTTPPGYHDDDETYLLYDLSVDPTESTNIYGQNPILDQVMRQKLRDYERFLVPPIPDNADCELPGVDFFNTSEFGPVWRPWCDSASTMIIYE